MRVIETQNEDYKYYTPKEAKEKDIEYYENWRDGDKGDWVLTDDGWIVRVLYRKRRTVNEVNKNGIIRIATGTFPTREGTELHTEHKGNRFTIGGRSSVEAIRERDPTIRDEIFVKQFIDTGDKYKAAEIAYHDRTDKAQKRIAANLLRNEKVRNLVSKKAQEAFQDLGIDFKWVAKNYKSLFDEVDDDKEKRKLLENIADIIGMNEKTKKKQIEGSYSGFSSKSVEAAEEEELPEDISSVDDDKKEERVEKAMKISEEVTE